MKRKYILQIKRQYYWEDVLTYYNQKEANISYLKLLASNIECRIVEVCYI